MELDPARVVSPIKTEMYQGFLMSKENGTLPVVSIVAIGRRFRGCEDERDSWDLWFAVDKGGDDK